MSASSTEALRIVPNVSKTIEGGFLVGTVLLLGIHRGLFRIRERLTGQFGHARVKGVLCSKRFFEAFVEKQTDSMRSCRARVICANLLRN